MLVDIKDCTVGTVHSICASDRKLMFAWRDTKYPAFPAEDTHTSEKSIEDVWPCRFWDDKLPGESRDLVWDSWQAVKNYRRCRCHFLLTNNPCWNLAVRMCVCLHGPWRGPPPVQNNLLRHSHQQIWQLRKYFGWIGKDISPDVCWHFGRSTRLNCSSPFIAARSKSQSLLVRAWISEI